MKINAKILSATLMSSAFLSMTAVGQTTNNVVINDSIKKAYDAAKHDIDNLKKLKISGWVQAQFQLVDSAGAATYDGGNFNANQKDRFMIRRGRVKFTYNQKYSQYVLQLNATERGVNLVEIFGKVTDPWTKSISLTGGVMNRPFGFEIQQSSADRETPERSRYVQMLLPNERDLGAMLTYQPIKGSALYGLKVDAGMFCGNGIYVPGTTSTGTTGSTTAAGLIDSDKYKDFMAHAHYKRSFKEEKYTLGIGASTYQGGIAYQNNKVYNTLASNAGQQYWSMADTTNGNLFKGNKAPRTYYAAELQFTMKWKLGTTTIRGEYMMGTQSGALDKTNSPNVTTVNASNTVSRQFNAGNVYFVQRIGKSKHDLVLKYEWYDPNSKLSASDFGAGTTFKAAELKYTMLGVGYVLNWDENVKFMVYYNIVKNEITTGIPGYTKDLRDNVLTFRMQYRF